MAIFLAGNFVGFYLHLVGRPFKIIKNIEGGSMDFKFKVFAKSVPSVCIVSGLLCVIVSQLNIGVNFTAVGVFLIIAGIGLQVLYLCLKYSKRDK